MTLVAFVRPSDDAAAADLSAWGDQVRRAAAAGQVQVVDLAGSANTSRAIVDQMLSSSPDHVLWFGHGRDDALIANSTVLVDATNIGGLNGVLVAIACDAARGLGPSCVGNRARAFLGFDDHLGWPAKAPNPTGDAITNGLACLFTLQHDVDCAAGQLRQHFAAARTEYENNGHAYGLTSGESMTAWLWAKSNGGSVRALGDPAATLT